MTRKWLLLDCQFLLYRQFYALKHIPDHEIQKAVLYNFFRDITKLFEFHETHRVVFCFDRGDSLRSLILPTYKSSRAKQYNSEPRDSQTRRKKLQRVIRRLRGKYLREVGFRNVFSQVGYEADDIIASVCKHSLKDDKAVIVTADHDFYQLLSPKVSIWHPITQHLLTFNRFRDQWKLEPEMWATVKALAGCKSDDILGVRGVGEKTATKFVNGSLDHDSKVYKLIIDNLKKWKKNLPLVKLPFADVNHFRLRQDELDKKTWREFAKRMKIRSLLSLEFR